MNNSVPTTQSNLLEEELGGRLCGGDKGSRQRDIECAALNDIARAGNMSRLARDVGMSREGLYQALPEDGNPSFATVMRITRALGLQVRIAG